jgi:hypothetical protein
MRATPKTVARWSNPSHPSDLRFRAGAGGRRADQFVLSTSPVAPAPGGCEARVTATIDRQSGSLRSRAHRQIMALSPQPAGACQASAGAVHTARSNLGHHYSAVPPLGRPASDNGGSRQFWAAGGPSPLTSRRCPDGRGPPAAPRAPADSRSAGVSTASPGIAEVVTPSLRRCPRAPNGPSPATKCAQVNGRHVLA